MNELHPRRLKSLEVLRAVAALLVVLFHTGLIFGKRAGVVVLGGLFAHGNRGVDLFFVLSGFIISYVHCRDWGEARRLGNYLFSRASRIFPGAWIMTGLALAMYGASGLLGVTFGFGGAAQAGRLDAWNVVASALLLPQRAEPLVNVTWTLKYEVLFYIVFALAIADRRLVALLVAWQGAVLGCVLTGADVGAGWQHYLLGPWCLEFGIGMACAWLVMHRSAVPMLARSAVQIAGLSLGTAVFAGAAIGESFVGRRAVLCDLLIYGAGSGLIVLSLVLLETSGRLRPSRVLVHLGDASYSIYLVNFSAINLLSAELFRRHALPVNQAAYLAFAAASVCVGVGFHRFVDQPIQRALRRMKPQVLGSFGATVGRSVSPT